MLTLTLAVPVILVGIDFSEAASAALRTAKDLARRLSGELRVIHVFDAHPSDYWRAESTALDWLAEVQLAPSSVEARGGVPWVELARRASEVDATYLVVGSHGRSGFQPIRVGSTAARVAVACSCPVVVVNPRSAKERPVQTAHTGGDRVSTGRNKVPKPLNNYRGF